MNERSVLVVDDDAATVGIMRMMLEDEGYRVLTADGSEAVQIARAEQPAVILLDVLMPRVDGFTVGASLRADPLTAHIPLVLMSAHECLAELPPRLRINDLLPKPFHFGDLYATVARWMAAPAWGTVPMDTEESRAPTNHVTDATR